MKKTQYLVCKLRRQTRIPIICDIVPTKKQAKEKIKYLQEHSSNADRTQYILFKSVDNVFKV